MLTNVLVTPQESRVPVGSGDYLLFVSRMLIASRSVINLFLYLRGYKSQTNTVERTKLCRSEVGHESVAMAQNRNAGEKKNESGRVEPAHYIIRRQFRAAEFHALYFTHGYHVQFF
ncbi:hypothetical protein EVAR_90207_1 [Eumeta japonica]|uniref:Uncharacterized protein n=1 Tax=Eumeta variegata TaxID=151549 RepID=A0A4C1WYR7_EUMVA|nr:hypothetical protein EVAR_90207_1 [Eumeta japonica]